MRFLIPACFVLATVFIAPAATPARADDDDAPKITRQINVSGECLREVVPDKGVVTVTATKIEPKVAQATQVVMDQYKQFHEKVKALNLKDMVLQTSDYSVQPYYEWVQPKPTEAGKNVLKGYQARMGLRVETTNIDRLGEVIAAAADVGIQDVGGFQMNISKQLEQKVRNECLSEAVGNARAQANLMAQAAGATLGKPISISENYRGPVFPMPYAAAPMMAKAAHMEMATDAAPPVQAGKADMQVSIQVSFELR